MCFLILVGVLVWYFSKLKASKNIIPQKEEITNGKNLKGQEYEKENANQIEKLASWYVIQKELFIIKQYLKIFFIILWNNKVVKS